MPFEDWEDEVYERGEGDRAPERPRVPGEWRVVGDRVEVTCEFGTHSALLGPLASAPAAVAREKLVELAKAAERLARPTADTARFNIRDA